MNVILQTNPVIFRVAYCYNVIESQFPKHKPTKNQNQPTKIPIPKKQNAFLHLQDAIVQPQNGNVQGQNAK